MLAAGEAPSAVRRRFSVFRKIMNDAVAMEMLARTPCRGVSPPADAKSEITVLTAGEVADLARAIHPWFSVWVWTAAYTGIRWSEMLGLRQMDLDLLRRTMVIRRQIVEVNGRFEGFGEPKTAAGRRSTVTLDRYGHLFPSLGLQIEEGLDATYRASLYAAAEPASVTPLRDAKMTQLTHG
jgi:integrase